MAQIHCLLWRFLMDKSNPSVHKALLYSGLIHSTDRSLLTFVCSFSERLLMATSMARWLEVREMEHRAYGGAWIVKVEAMKAGCKELCKVILRGLAKSTQQRCVRTEEWRKWICILREKTSDYGLSIQQTLIKHLLRGRHHAWLWRYKKE